MNKEENVKANMPPSKGVEGRMKKVKGLRGTNWQLHSSNGDVKYCTGNIVNNTILTMYGAIWVQDLFGGPLGKLYKSQYVQTCSEYQL